MVRAVDGAVFHLEFVEEAVFFDEFGDETDLADDYFEQSQVGAVFGAGLSQEDVATVGPVGIDGAGSNCAIVLEDNEGFVSVVDALAQLV